MKKPLLAGLIAILSFVHCHAVSIKGQITAKSGALPEVIYLRSFFNPSQNDSIPVDKFGGFKLELTNPSPASYALSHGQSSFHFFINPAEQGIRISLVVSEKQIEKGGVEDSRESNAFEDLEQLMKEYDKELVNMLRKNAPDSTFALFVSDYNKELSTFQGFYRGTYTAEVLAQMRKIRTEGSFSSSRQNLKNSFLANINFADTSILENPLYDNMLEFYRTFVCDTTATGGNEFISTVMAQAKQNNKMYKHTASKIFEQVLAGNEESMMLSYMHWFRSAADTTLLPVLKAKLQRLSNVMPGKPMVELQYTNTQGQVESLQNSVAHNKLTLLLVWQSDCSHCREEMPAIVKLYGAYHAKGLEIFAVSLDEDQQKWKTYLQQNNIPWKNVLADMQNGNSLEKYVITRTPAFVLINQQGVIEHRLIDGKQLEGYVKGLLR